MEKIGQRDQLVWNSETLENEIFRYHAGKAEQIDSIFGNLWCQQEFWTSDKHHYPVYIESLLFQSSRIFIHMDEVWTRSLYLQMYFILFVMIEVTLSPVNARKTEYLYHHAIYSNVIAFVTSQRASVIIIVVVTLIALKIR